MRSPDDPGGAWSPAADGPPRTEAGWRAFAAAYLPLFWSVARGKFGLPWHDAEEAVSRTWETVYARRESMPGGADRRRWLASVLCWKCRDVLRQRANPAPLPADLPGPGQPAPDTVVSLVERREIVLAVLAELPERDRTLLAGRYLEDPPRTYAQLGGALGVAENSVGALLSRALKRMGRRLRDRGLG